MIGIYIITHKDSFKRYVGQSVDITKRLRRHWGQLKNGKHENRYLQHAYNKYGRDAFTETVIECGQDILTSVEQTMLSQWSNLYNINKIAGVPPSQKGKKKGPQTPEHIALRVKNKSGTTSRKGTSNAVLYKDYIVADRATGMSVNALRKKYKAGINYLKEILQ
jgi:group I intron endonuclease